jgi:adenosylhomocysteine nucleosidase
MAMPHKGVVIVAAMARELAPLLRGVRSQKVDGIEFFELNDAVVAVGGVGEKAARHTAESLVSKYSPEVLVSAGLVGALTPKLKVGDVVEVKKVVDAGSGAKFETGRGTAVLVTGSSVSGPADKPIEAERWNADIVDMEAFAEAAVAKEHGIEFMAIKAVSDEVDFPMPPLGRFVSDKGKFETLRFLAWVAVRPKWWSAVRRLNANSNVAATNLSQALTHLIEQRARFEREKEIRQA